MSDGIKMGSKCECVGQTEQGCDTVERGWDCEAVGRSVVRGVRLQAEPVWGWNAS